MRLQRMHGQLDNYVMASGLLKVEHPANNGTGLVPGRLSLSSDNLATGSRLGNGERGGSLTPNLPSTMDRLSAPILTRRKFSFPANLHSTALLGFPEIGHRDGMGSSLSGSSTGLSARRRLSNVSDVVTRKLSSTIGWKQPVLPSQDIITQGKCLCGQYIRCRLKRSGVFNRKLGLQRIRSIVGTPSIHVVREVFPALLSVGEELERMYPRIYNGIARQLTRFGRGELKTPETAPVLLSAIARDLFKVDITWGKVVSLFAIAGGLSVDCVRQGHPDYLPKLVEGVADVIEDELVTWISENGGWIGLANKVRPPQEEITFTGRCLGMKMSSTAGGLQQQSARSPIVAAAVAAASAIGAASGGSAGGVVGWTNKRSPIHHLTTSQDVINQGKCLCGEYIRARLKRTGLLNRKTLQRLRNSMEHCMAGSGVGIGAGGGVVVREALPILNGMGEELERMHPRLYTNVSRQISNEPWGELTEPDTVGYLLHVVAKDLFKSGITWGKVISLFAISGGLAVDCVRQDHADYLQQLIEGTADVIEEDLSGWLVERGGWLGLQDHVHPPQPEISVTGWLSITALTLAVIYVVSLFLRVIGSSFVEPDRSTN
uniref:Bcl-2 Bcl-2 homology region 1-3 domain-containing protein n=1 Tax=Anopheles christyi TaxID=43041 RepID=A0A182K049_9DIPT